ncbi:glycine zipper 2TM domain-containing protein [Novosphingobium sp. G106]|uniref:glycine zipper 2TM domain-containing protein n=1 Tax=Novosphingobium sp. G106 TaxID=2849500 RepID=UPI001C2D1E99|nr:glycine zipper 2TM domain-containing protein [Novosphingobium sp. G106]MBV1691763.1 glycine zipper 2TM domain-containing protein [Novosphingobium sp. G106]
MRKLLIAATLAAVAIPALPAAADPPPWAPAHGRRAHEQQSMYDSSGRYREPHRLGRNDQVWRGNDGRYYCKRNNGTTGLIVGAAAGALLGRAIDTRGDRLLGTLLGGTGGALLGREIDRGGVSCR